MPPIHALLNRPSGTPLSGTAPGMSGSALTLRRWNIGSGSLIVGNNRPRIWISAVSRWYDVSTSTLLQASVALSAISGEDNSPGGLDTRELARGTARGTAAHRGTQRPARPHLDLSSARRGHGGRSQRPGRRRRNGHHRRRRHPSERTCPA